MKKNNTTEKTIRNAEKLAQALKEGTEKTLQNLVNEAISNLILEDEEIEEPAEADDEDVVDDNSFDEEDVDVENDSETEDDVKDDENVEEAPESDDEEGEDDGWSDFDEFKTDDNDYDFTGEDENIGEKLLQIFNKIEDGDQIIVTKDGNEAKVSEINADAEEVIELGTEDNDDVEVVSDDDFEVELDDEEPKADDEEFEFEVEDDDDKYKSEDDDEEFEFEYDDEDSDNELEESIGYTTTYQKKTAMTTPSNKEVANPSATYSMDNVPEGDDRRYGKKIGSSKPFGAKSCCEGEEIDAMVDEPSIEEGVNVGGAVQARSTSKSKIPAGRKPYVPKGTKHASFGAEYKEVVESLNAIKAENKALKESLEKHVKSLREAAVLNVNLGKVIRLLSEETTTRDEKKRILTRFNNVKTINEGAALYETIKGELKESKKSTVKLSESIAVGEKTNLNETTIFNRNDNPSLGLMDRMDNLYRK